VNILTCRWLRDRSLRPGDLAEISASPPDLSMTGHRRSAGLAQINPDDVATLREVQRPSQGEAIN
jgi:hypothetical protein